MPEIKKGKIARVLELRELTAKSNIKKYSAMLEYACADNRARGCFQFYGASTGRERFARKSNHPWVHLTGNHKQDVLLNDLVNTPHAFVLACLMDKQIKAERAWAIPCIIMDELGTDINALNSVSEDEYLTYSENFASGPLICAPAEQFLSAAVPCCFVNR